MAFKNTPNNKETSSFEYQKFPPISSNQDTIEIHVLRQLLKLFLFQWGCCWQGPKSCT